MKNKFFLKKGSELHLSELGHRNFVYPSKDFVVLREECKAEKMCWVGSDNLVPMKLDSSVKSDNAKVTSVVWVDKKNILEGA